MSLRTWWANRRIIAYRKAVHYTPGVCLMCENDAHDDCVSQQIAFYCRCSCPTAIAGQRAFIAESYRRREDEETPV